MVLKDLLIAKRRIWIIDITKNNCKLPKKPRNICKTKIERKISLKLFFAFLFWSDANFKINGESKIVKTTIRIRGFL